MNRRNVLVGIALVAVVSGLALGSGAFTQVEATRDVTLSTQGDSSALLQFSNGTGADGIVNFANDQGVSMVQLDQDNLNEDAVTRFNDSLEVTNSGDNPVLLSVNSTAGMSFVDSNGNALDSNTVNIPASGSEELDIAIDLTGTTQGSDLPSAVTFNATAT